MVGKCRSSPRVRERRRPSTNRRRRRRCKKVVQRGPPSSTIRHGPSSELPPVAPTPENATTTETSSIKHHRRCDDEKLGTRRTLVRRNPRERLVRVFRRTLSKVRSSLPSAPPQRTFGTGYEIDPRVRCYVSNPDHHGWRSVACFGAAARLLWSLRSLPAMAR